MTGEQCDGDGVVAVAGSYPGDISYESCPGCENCSAADNNVIPLSKPVPDMLTCSCGSTWFNGAMHFQRRDDAYPWRLAAHSTGLECAECGVVVTLSCVPVL